MNVLILNHTKVHCGTYQFCKRIYELAKNSKTTNYLYREVSSYKEYSELLGIIKPDCVLINYHWDRMPWLADQNVINKTRHYGIYHDGSMLNSIYKYLFFGGFDIHKVDAIDKRILLPRPIYNYSGEYPVNTIPTIGSFGFSFNNKRFPELVKLVSDTFKTANIRFHMTQPYFGDGAWGNLQDIINRCNNEVKRSSIHLTITTDFISENEVLTFLAGNDINVFNYELYHGNGISSVPDYALAVKRPIAITNNMMFRHIVKDEILLEKHSIKEILSYGTAPIEEFYGKWSTENFITQMDQAFA